MARIGKKSRELALGKMKTKSGETKIFTTAGMKVKSKAGDVAKTNKKGESVVVRKGGNRVITKADGTVVRVKRDGTRVVSVPSGYEKTPTTLKPIKGSTVNPKK
jgi:hypothetical protein